MAWEYKNYKEREKAVREFMEEGVPAEYAVNLLFLLKAEGNKKLADCLHDGMANEKAERLVYLICKGEIVDLDVKEDNEYRQLLKEWSRLHYQKKPAQSPA